MKRPTARFAIANAIAIAIASLVAAAALSDFTPLLAGDLLVSSRYTNAVLRYDATTGAPKGVFASGNGLANPNGIAFGPDGALYVGLGDVGEVQRYDRDGKFLGKLVSGGSGGLAGCRAIAFGPDGNLYVDAGSIDKVLRYDGKTGAFLGVAAEGHGLAGPVGLTFGPDGTLYVAGALSNTIHAFRPDGTFVRTFAPCAGSSSATGVLVGPDGLLYGADAVRNRVHRYDPATGACLGVFATGGGLTTPIGLTRGAAGDLLVGSFGTDSVLSYSFQDGRLLGTFIASGAGGLDGTHNFAFVPDLPLESTRLVPIVLDVASAGARYTTELALTNRGATPVTATLRYHPSLGAPAGGSVPLALASGQQLLVADVIGLLREKGLALSVDEPQAGTLEVVFSGAESDDVVAATARTTTAVASPEGRAGLAYGALRAGSTTRLTVYGLRESATDRSNLALLSTSAEPVTLKVTVRSGSGDGAAAVVREAETLAPFGWMQIGRVLSGTGTSNGWAEVERVGGTGSFSAYGVVNDNVTNDGSFLPPVPEGRSGSRLTVPVVAEAANLGSELVLTNRSGSPATLTLSYVRSVTTPAGGDGVSTVALAPGEQRIVPDALAFLREAGVPVGAAGETHVGSLRIGVSGAPLDQVFAAARTSFRGGGGSFGLFTPAVAPAEEAGDEVALYGLRADAANRTNVAVVNSGADAAGPVTLEILTYDGDAGGAGKGTPIRQALEPGQHAQVNLILGNAGIRNGWVRARRVDGTAPWLAYGVVNDGGVPGERTGDGAYVAMSVPSPSPAPPGTVGAAGGTVALADGSAVLVVPPGALASPVPLTVSRRGTPPLDPNLDPGSLVDISPADVRFAFPATLALRYDPARGPAGLAESRLGVQRQADAAATVWEPAARPAVDTSTRTARGDVALGGTYGVRRLPSNAPCTSLESRQYDFWLGAWDYTAANSFPGTNTITRDAEGCVVEESFTQRSYRGRSVNLYDPSTAKWYQTYIDTDGNRMVLVGTYTGDRMLLYETPVRRHSWLPLDANRIRLALEESTNGGATWVERFNALYTRR